MKALILIFSIAFAVAAPEREKRQLPNCIDTFHNVPNPCVNNPTKMVYFPHPNDVTKFIQCDVFGRMLIIQCPQGEQYNQATVTCVGTQPATQSPPQVNNPCTAANLAAGRLYFALTNDNSRFIECDQNGQANILTCPSQLIWDEARLSCVYTFTGPVTPTPASLPAAGIGTNPCRGQVVTAAGLFFSHPDPNKFIQCDLAGDAFVLSCPSGLVWNEFSKTCISPYLVQLGTGGSNGVGRK